MDRAYSLLEIRSVSEDERLIEGIASTPTADRMGDIVEPLGAKFALPMPLLWQHDSAQPIGNVEFAKPTKAGIPFKARLAQTDEPGTLKDRLDEAWQSIKLGLVRAVSIGFRDLAHEVMKDGGWRFTEWEWLELSAVTIPANAEATITTIKSLDHEALAASGKPPITERREPPGDSGKSLKTPVAPKEGKRMTKTIAEQISAFEATRVAKSARMEELMNTAAEEGVTLDDAGTEEYDGLETEVKSIDAHLVRLASLEKSNKAKAVAADGSSSDKGSDSRGGVRVEFKGNNLPKGTAFTRYAMALARSKGNLMQAAEIAKGWHDSTPEVETVLRAAVAAGTTTDATWAEPLVEYNTMSGEFIELLRPATIIGRIPGLRRVPFNISMPRQTAGAAVGWVGEGKPKPVGKGAFDTVTLRWAKCAGIVVLTDELVRFSNPSAEAIVRQDLVDGIAQFLDEQFTDPSVAAVSNVSPASITNGVTPIAPTGTDGDALRADFKTLVAAFIAQNMSLSGAVWIMPEVQALALSLLTNALGQSEFPGITMTGGTLLGLPVVTSTGAGTLENGSPEGVRIILAKASEIMLADDGQVVLDASREASIQMDSAPDDPADANTVLMSLWQHNMVGIRAERWINWQKRRTGAVQFIDNAAYGAS